MKSTRYLAIALLSLFCVTGQALDRLAVGEEASLIEINYKDTPLMEIVTSYATKLGINILPPAGNNPLSQKITFSLKNPIPVHRAIDFLEVILSTSGYVLTKDNHLYRINKIDQDLQRKPVPVFVNSEDKIPNSPQEICVIHSFENIQAPSQDNAPSSSLYKIIKEVLTDTAQFFFDQKSNSVIMFDQANSVKIVLEIIEEFDVLSNDKIHIIIKPKYIDGSSIATLVDNDIKVDSNSSGGYRAPSASNSKDQFIDKSTNIFAEPRTNRIIALGNQRSLDNLQLLVKALDKPHEQGRSVIHVKPLKYLDASKFGPILTNILKSPGSGSQSGAKSGLVQEFRGVIVGAEGYTTLEGPSADSGGDSSGGQIQQGGNNLIIAAYSSDWVEIEKIIDQLDTPQPQIIIETLIVDLSGDDSRSLGATIRNPVSLGLSDSIGFQADHLLVGPITDGTVAAGSSNGLTTDLFTTNTTIPGNLTKDEEQGATLASFADSAGVWTIFKALQKNKNAKIIAHPFGITQNNKKLTLKQGTIKRVTGGSSSEDSVATTIDQQDLPAHITIEVVPRITAQNRVNLDVSVLVQEFKAGSGSFNGTARNHRNVTTNSTIKSGEIMPIGGLVKVTESDVERKTPLFGSIPIIGSLFSSRAKTVIKQTLEIYVSATIVDHHCHLNAHKFTDYQIRNAATDLGGGGEDILYDDKAGAPITRMFFKNADRDKKLIRQYIDSGYNTHGLPLTPPPPPGDHDSYIERKEALNQSMSHDPTKHHEIPSSTPA
ncbi:hypothetical protein HOK96_03370 [bacterium]|nr:hypothetical protein [bacterium]